MLHETGQLLLEVYSWFKALIQIWNAARRLCFNRTAWLRGYEVLCEVMQAGMVLIAGQLHWSRCWAFCLVVRSLWLACKGNKDQADGP